MCSWGASGPASCRQQPAGPQRSPEECGCSRVGAANVLPAEPWSGVFSGRREGSQFDFEDAGAQMNTPVLDRHRGLFPSPVKK